MRDRGMKWSRRKRRRRRKQGRRRRRRRRRRQRRRRKLRVMTFPPLLLVDTESFPHALTSKRSRKVQCYFCGVLNSHGVRFR